MSLFARRLRPGESDRHDAVERRIAALGAHVQPDPLFRRRLRSSTINRYVAVREQVGKRATGRPRRRHMGRVGRSVLLVTVTLAASAATVLGASRDALPGDALYNVKLRVEGLRFEVVPAHLHAVLAADVVGQRIEEIARLVDAGRSADVLALQPAFEEALAHLERASVASGPAVRARAGEQVVVLDAYIVHLSAEARAIVRGAWVDATSRESTRPLDADVPTSNRGAGGAEGPGRVATPGWAGPGAAAQPTQSATGRTTEPSESMTNGGEGVVNEASNPSDARRPMTSPGEPPSGPRPQESDPSMDLGSAEEHRRGTGPHRTDPRP